MTALIVMWRTAIRLASANSKTANHLTNVQIKPTIHAAKQQTCTVARYLQESHYNTCMQLKSAHCPPLGHVDALSITVESIRRCQMKRMLKRWSCVQTSSWFDRRLRHFSRFHPHQEHVGQRFLDVIRRTVECLIQF